jgi:hypothetical protein
LTKCAAEYASIFTLTFKREGIFNYSLSLAGRVFLIYLLSQRGED